MADPTPLVRAAYVLAAIALGVFSVERIIAHWEEIKIVFSAANEIYYCFRSCCLLFVAWMMLFGALTRGPVFPERGSAEE